MGLSGSFSTMGFPDLLQWLFHAQKTGTLLLHGIEIEKSVFFEKGIIVATSSNDPREYLGQFLINYGYITEEELKKAMEVQKEFNMLLGKILVMIDAISEEELQTIMKIKAEETLYDIFTWEEGEFNFIENYLPEIKMVPLQLEAPRIIMEGLQRADEWKVIKEVIPSLETIPKKIGEFHLSSEIRERDKILYDLIDGKKNINNLSYLVRSRPFYCARSLYYMYKEKIVEFEIVEKEKEENVELVQLDEGLIETVRMITKASMLIKKGEWDIAWDTIQNAKTLRPQDPDVVEKYEQIQSFILTELGKLGITPSSIPKLTKSLTEITNEFITPKESYALSRIDGKINVKTIASLLPIHIVDTFLSLYHLKKKGLITINEP